MNVETKYDIGGRVSFRPAEQWRSDVLIGKIVEVKVIISEYSKFIAYTIDDVRTVDGKLTSVDMRTVNEEDIFDVVY